MNHTTTVSNIDTMDMLDMAMSLASAAHAGQVDKSGMPYIAHICAVVAGVDEPLEKTVAALHDILEDTDVTVDQLNKWFSVEVIEAVEAMTKNTGEKYEDYLARVKVNKLARAVKLADLRHNSDLSRLSSPTDKDRKRALKYRRAIEYLEESH